MSAQHIRATIVAAALIVTALSPAVAQDRGRWHEGHEREWRGGDWHDRDIHRFREHDFDRWRGGRWFHARHDGRFGWWWVVGPSWYFYPAPVYPYPDPYTPPYATPAAPAWYFCPPAQAYYPYVPSCPVPWQIVPAQ
jgi:hypothetical protein